MKQQNNHRLAVLDVIRVLTCAMLVIWHIAEVFKIPLGRPIFVLSNYYTLSLGGIGVSLFLILSGLVLELRYGNKKFGYWDFFSKRLVRIYPIYWGCLAIGIITYLYREWFLHSSATFFRELTIREWVCSLTGTCSFFGWWGGPFVTTGWFIGLIVSLYALFPLINRLLTRFSGKGLALIFFISLITHIAIYKGWLGWGWSPQEWIPLARLFEFTLGMWLGKIIPLDWWHQTDLLIPAKSLWKYLGELSFPMFLVHFEFRFIFTAVTGLMPPWLAVVVFVVVSGIISQGILAAVTILSKNTFQSIFKPKKAALSRIFNAGSSKLR